MNDKGNVFDVSSTLMEIEDLPDSEAEPAVEEVAPPLDSAPREPDYFTPKPTKKKPNDMRRRALAALAVVGGAILTVTLVGAATGSGDDSRPEEPLVAEPASEAPAGAGGVEPAWRKRVEELEMRRAMEARAEAERRRRLAAAKREAEERRERRRRAAAAATAPKPAPEPAPESETTYAPEPEATYVPVEEAPPPAPAPAPAPSGGGQPEFGFEP